MKRALVLLLTIGVFIAVAYAHSGMQHVMGTVTAVADTSITVKTTGNITQTVSVTADTKYFNGTRAITVKEIKVGDHIVIHATKKGDQITAAEVKVGVMNTKETSSDMGGMKMDSSPNSTPK